MFKSLLLTAKNLQYSRYFDLPIYFVYYIKTDEHTKTHVTKIHFYT